jgi:PAS domain S-box-containing protein
MKIFIYITHYMLSMGVSKKVQEQFLAVIAQKGNHGMTISDIAKEVALERHTVSKYLVLMQGQGFVYYRSVGKAKLWFINRAPLKTILNSLTSNKTFTEQILSKILTNIPLGLIVIDKDYNILYMNEEMQEKYAGCEGKTFYEAIMGKRNPLCLKDITKLIDQKQEQCNCIVKDRNNHFLHIFASHLSLPDGHTSVILLIDDITKQKKSEQERELLHGITDATTQVGDFPSAIEIALMKICETTEWEYGEAWLPDKKEKCLMQASVWYGNSKKYNEFYTASSETTFAFKQGLAGRVWASKKPEWITDLTEGNPLPFHRKETAQKVGFKAVFGVPILTGNTVLAVLVFFTKRQMEKDPDMVLLVSTVAQQLGLVFEQKKHEEIILAQKQLLEAERNALNTAAILVETDLDGKITFVNDNFVKISGYSRSELCGKTHKIVNSGYHTQEFFKDLWETIIAGKVWKGTIKNKRKDHSFYWTDATIAPVLGKEKKPIKYLAIRYDITKHMEKQGENK